MHNYEIKLEKKLRIRCLCNSRNFEFEDGVKVNYDDSWVLHI